MQMLRTERHPPAAASPLRDRAAPDSDVDILVEFDGPATSKRCFGVRFYLEDLLGQPIDLVTEKMLRWELRPFIEDDTIWSIIQDDIPELLPALEAFGGGR